MQIHPRIIYASFDRFPSAKGAATHINAFVRGLGSHFGNVDLLTIQSEAQAINQQPDPPLLKTNDHCDPTWSASGVLHHGLPAEGGNLFERVLGFRTQLGRWWQENMGDERADVFHFRSIFEAYPIARNKSRFCRKMIYEVNGLPSIELKYHYPAVATDDELLRKLRFQEQTCLEASDQIITVSDVNAAHIASRGIEEKRITVIRNGVDTRIFKKGPPKLIATDRPLQVLYSGTLSPWQGVQYAIEAVSLLRRDHAAELLLVGPIRPRQKKELDELIWKYQLVDHVQILPAVPQQELNVLQHQADVILAPLTRNDRNLVQGCCPLKIVEAMASGTTIIASDLPVVRELVNDTEVLFAKPGSAKSIKDSMLRLIENPNLAAALGNSAAISAQQSFPWTASVNELIATYERLLSQSRTMAS